MRSWIRLMAAGLALGLVLALWTSPSSAAPRKKSTSSSKSYVPGTNLEGRSGLIYGDTSHVTGVGEVDGGVFFTFQSYGVTGFSGSFITVPGGIRFGIEKNLELSLGGVMMMNSYPEIVVGPVTIEGGTSTAFSARGGVKYRIAGGKDAPDFSVGGDVTLPVSPSFGSNVLIHPRGTVSYGLGNGLLLNGDMGILFGTNGGSAVVTLDLGAAYPFSDKVTGIASVGANQDGLAGSMFSGGARFHLSNIELMAFLGAPLNGGNVVLGGGIGF